MDYERFIKHNMPNQNKGFASLGKTVFLFVLCFSFSISSIMGGQRLLMAAGAAKKPLSPNEKKLFFDRAKEVRKNIMTFEAEFKEERSVPSLKKPFLFDGRLFYHQNGLFFMEYLKPVHYFIHIKGKEAIFYVEGNKTADLMDTTELKGPGSDPGLFRWDPDTFKGEILADDRGYYLEDKEERKGDKNAGRRLTIFLDKKTLFAKQIDIEDAFGDRTTIILSNIKINHELPTSVLRFSLPEGVIINRLSRP